MKKDKKELTMGTLFLGLFIIGLVIIVFLVGLLYWSGPKNLLAKTFVHYFPCPVALVNNKFISFGELDNRSLAVQKFYENQDFSEFGFRVDFSTEEGKKRLLVKEKYLLNRLIEDKIIELEAQKSGITITEEMVAQELERKLADYGNKEQMEDNLARLYGWGLKDFQNNIVKPDLYRKKLTEKFKETDSSFPVAKEKMNQALNDLKNSRDFEAVVQKYSEGESAKKNGELGWFSAEEMLPEIAQEAFSLKKETISGIIETDLGYHIIKVEDKKKEEDNEKVKLKQIFVRTNNFSDWLWEKEKEYTIYIPVRTFFWDKKAGQVEFQNEELKSFEENLRINYSDDISIIF